MAMADFEWAELTPGDIAQLDKLATDATMGYGPIMSRGDGDNLEALIREHARLRAEVEQLREDAQRWRDSRLDE